MSTAARTVVATVTVGLALVVVAAAVRAEANRPGATAGEAVLVGVVGAALLVSAATARGPTAMRRLVAAVGVAWLLASFLPATLIVHQAVLAVALVAFPTGRVRGPGRWVLVAFAVPVALMLVPQPGVAALFGSIALATVPRLRTDPVAGAFPTAAATAVAIVLGGSWAVSRLASDAFDAGVALLAYELVLLAVATGFVLAARAVVADRTRLADRLLADAESTGTRALTRLLAATLRDPSLRVLPYGEGAPDAADDREPAGAADHSSRAGPPRQHLEVRDESRLLAVVLHHSPALDDGPTAAATVEAVRLVLLNEQRRRELDHRAEALRAARARVVAATDRQRVLTADRLRTEVVRPLQRILSSLPPGALPPDGLPPDAVGNAAAPDPVAVAAGEVAAAVEDIDALVAGVPPVALGGGRLGPALERLARRASIPTEVSVGAGSAGTPEQEAALLYVCTEALTNVVKHADASSVRVVLTSDGSGLTLRVSDDGRGGVDPTGSGLRGLADRLQVVGGRLRVESPPGAGTTVRASVPG